jgi:hypothetical protein
MPFLSAIYNANGFVRLEIPRAGASFRTSFKILKALPVSLVHSSGSLYGSLAASLYRFDYEAKVRYPDVEKTDGPKKEWN